MSSRSGWTGHRPAILDHSDRDRRIGTGVWGQEHRDRSIGTGVSGQEYRDRRIGAGVSGQVYRGRSIGTGVSGQTYRDRSIGAGASEKEYQAMLVSESLSPVCLLSILTLRGLSGNDGNLLLGLFSDQNILYEYLLRGGYFCITKGGY